MALDEDYYKYRFVNQLNKQFHDVIYGRTLFKLFLVLQKHVELANIYCLLHKNPLIKFMKEFCAKNVK